MLFYPLLLLTGTLSLAKCIPARSRNALIHRIAVRQTVEQTERLEPNASAPFIMHYPELSSSIDPSIDPCVDFYSYVCNGWKKSNPIPNDKKNFNQMNKLEDAITKELEAIINEPVSPNETREKYLMKLYHKKCVDNLKVAPHDGLRMLLGRIRWLRGNAFFFTDWLLEMNPTSAFYEVVVVPDDDNSTNNIITIAPSNPLLSFSSYFDPAYAEEYVAMRKSLFGLFKLLSHDDPEGDMFDYSQPEIARRVDSLFRIDQNMAKIQQETEFSTLSITISVLELGERLMSVDWPRYIGAIFPPEMMPTIPYRMVALKQVATILKYEELLSTMDPLMFWDYLEWKVIFHYAPFLGEKYNDLLEKYNKQVYGIERGDRKRDCTEMTINYFPDVVSSIWLQRHFDFNIVEIVSGMVDILRSSFLELLKSNEWMDMKTKERARRKAHAIIPFIGYDAKSLTSEAIQKKYSKLDFDDHTSFYRTSQQLERWGQLNNYEKLDKKNRRDSFESRATETNAFYDPNQNQIAILAGILRPPFFNASWPEAMNIAAIGMVIGHEITHAFDDYGAYFDETGSRQNWWNPETLDHFENKAECVEHQYDNITIVEGVNINGKRTKGENIADNGGMRAAIQAVSRLLANTSLSIEGLSTSNPWQTFFISYAFTWCGNVRDHALLSELATESHSPATARVNTVLSNQPEFAQAFSCPAGSPMNPTNRCIVW